MDNRIVIQVAEGATFDASRIDELQYSVIEGVRSALTSMPIDTHSHAVITVTNDGYEIQISVTPAIESEIE
jgi:hypothetical protein